MKINPIGRYSYRNNHYYFYNGGSGFSFKFKGKSVSIHLESTPVECYFYVIIDRDYNNKIKASTKDGIFFYKLKDGIHYIDVIKANEANDNTLELIDLKVEGELLEYDHQFNGNIKVYGDSTIAGFGILAHEGEASIHNSDAVRDFCFHALYEMNMDMNMLFASGYGLVFSIYTEPQEKGIINFIDKVAVEKKETWEDDNKYDLLIISLGTNDNSYITAYSKGTQTFIDTYKKLIDHELEKNKDLKILMVSGTLLEKNVYHLYDETWKQLKPLYPNLFAHRFKGDNSGISYHAYVDAHDRMKQELIDVIKKIL